MKSKEFSHITKYVKTVSLLALVITAVLAYADTPLLNKASAYVTHAAKAAQSTASSVTPTSTTSYRQTSPLTTILQNQINDIIANYPNVTTSASVIDLNSHTSQTYSYTGAMIGASTTKVLTAAAYMAQVEAGQASLDQQIDGTPASDLIYGMINQSNNDDWADLNDYLTYQGLQQYADQHGLTSYDWTTNSISTADEASLLEQLYDHKLLSPSNTQTILSAMQNTNEEDLIPPELPTGAIIYHKYGEYETSLHDAAIIQYDGRAYVLVIYTANSDELDFTTQQSIIQQIAHAVIDAESNQS